MSATSATNLPGIFLLAIADEAAGEAGRRGLDTATPAGAVRVVATAADLLDYVRRRGRFGTAALGPLPDAVIIDLALPGLNPRAVLRTMRASPAWSGVPVVLLGSGRRGEGLVGSHELDTTLCIRKPDTDAEWAEVWGAVRGYWCGAGETRRVG